MFKMYVLQRQVLLCLLLVLAKLCPQSLRSEIPDLCSQSRHAADKHQGLYKKEVQPQFHALCDNKSIHTSFSVASSS
jgi:hypothetical protein